MAEDILGEFKFEGYKQPSAYKMGKGAFETAVKGIGYKNIDDFNEYLASKGIGNVGKDANATKELNRLRVEAGLEPYRKIPPIQAKAEKIITDSSDPVTTRSKRAMINIGLKSISDRAEKIDGDENKLRFIVREVGERFPQLAREMVESVARKLFLAVPIAGIVAEVAMSPSAEAAEVEPSFEDMMMERIRQSDFSGPSASSMLLEQMKQDAVMKAGGGMMDINNMIRPLTFDVGGIAAEDEGKTFGRGEFSYDDPKLIKFIQKKADQNNTTYQEELMKFVDQVESFYRNKKAEGGIMTSMPVGYKMGTRKGDLVGDKEKGITSIKIGLMEDTGDLNILGMKLILQEAADTLEEMDKIEKMSSKEIIKMFENFMGKQGT